VGEWRVFLEGIRGVVHQPPAVDCEQAATALAWSWFPIGRCSENPFRYARFAKPWISAQNHAAVLPQGFAAPIAEVFLVRIKPRKFDHRNLSKIRVE